MKVSIAALKKRNTRNELYRYWISDVFFGSANILIHYSLRYVPLWMNSYIGDKLGQLAGKKRFIKKNERAKHNLKVFRPGMKEKDIDDLLQQMWGNIGKTMCEYSVLDKLWDKGCVNIINSHIIDACVARHEAIIFTGAHLGNWEAQAAYAREHNLPLMAMYKPVRNRFSERIADIARDRMRIITVPTDRHATKKMCRHLANKGTLWLPIDDFKNGQVHTPRFGRPLTLHGTNAAYIVRLARRYHAAIIPVRTKRIDSSIPSLEVTLYDAMYVDDDQDINIILEKLDKMIEGWVLENPEQWYMLHELRLE